ncbi:MAG: hypothetical protein E7324_03800 [Clostridiales bacterium]|nr:hypothetical protein [Clostridiales bacterium]
MSKFVHDIKCLGGDGIPARNRAREQYVYHARKFDKRTYEDIGRDLGITKNRVRQIYVRIDWELKKKGPHAPSQ